MRKHKATLPLQGKLCFCEISFIILIIWEWVKFSIFTFFSVALLLILSMELSFLLPSQWIYIFHEMSITIPRFFSCSALLGHTPSCILEIKTFYPSMHHFALTYPEFLLSLCCPFTKFGEVLLSNILVLSLSWTIWYHSQISLPHYSAPVLSNL